MKTKTKRFLSVLVAALLSVWIFPAGVLAADAVLPDGVSEWTDPKPVYFAGEYYDTLAAALTAVYMSTPTETAEVYCKPGADVGSMTHAHVADDLTIYGNGAKVTGGEHDLEIDTYKYSRLTGKQDRDNGSFLDKEITITVKGLNGIAIWGQRNTENTVNVSFENCQNMNRVYISGGKGKNNISLKSCSFVAENGSHANTSIYSNAEGTIRISDCTFAGISVPINLNNKSAGTQTVTVTGTTFTDCSTAAGTAANNTATYAAPIRVLAQKGATTSLTVEEAAFVYTGENTQAGNGDILLGDGRADSFGSDGQPEATGTVKLEMDQTKATIHKQVPGYYGADGKVADAEKNVITKATANDRVITNTDESLTVVCKHVNMKETAGKEATCTEDGVETYWVCEDCKEMFADAQGKTPIEKPVVIAAKGHSFKDGKCTVCSATDPDYTGNNPATGVESGLLFAAALMIGVGALGAMAYGKKRREQN